MSSLVQVCVMFLVISFISITAYAQEGCVTPAEFHAWVIERHPWALLSQELTPVPSLRGVEAVIYEGSPEVKISTVVVASFFRGCLADLQEMKREQAYDYMSVGS